MRVLVGRPCSRDSTKPAFKVATRHAPSDRTPTQVTRTFITIMNTGAPQTRAIALEKSYNNSVLVTQQDSKFSQRPGTCC